MTNEERANLAEEACVKFASGTGLAWEGDEQTEAISDIICNLGHLADRLKLDYLQIVAGAISVHAAEVVDEDDLASEPLVTIKIKGRTVKSK